MTATAFLTACILGCFDARRCSSSGADSLFRATKPAPGTNGPLIPGDPEREAEKVRSKDGVPLIMPVVEELRAISKKIGIPFS